MYRTRVLAFILAGIGLGITLTRAQTVADLATVEQRLTTSILGSVPSASSVQSYQASMLADGSWSDIAYTSTVATNWAPLAHLDRLSLLCRSYAHPSSTLYQNSALLSNILKAYDCWITKNPQSTNWWHNQIAVPQDLGEIMVLIKGQLSTARITSGLAVVQRAYVARSTNSGTNTGQNRVDRAIAGIARGVVAGSTSVTADAFLAISDTILVTTAEGIQRDASFHQHGAQLYNQGYGSLFISNTLKWAAMGADTGFAFSENQRHILTDYLLDGTRWMARGQAMDYTASGRGVSRKGQSTNAAGIGGLATSSIAVSASYRIAELDALKASSVAANATGSADPALVPTGAKHFWRSDLTTWHRPAAYASVKISSTRTLQPETGNDEGLKNLHLGDGVNLIFRSGNEYDDIMPVWNWRKLPGTTIEQGTYSLKPSADWGVAGTSTYAGGLSDGNYAATAFKYNRRNIAAKKSWFFLDGAYVALGADINAPGATSQVETTLNQSLLSGPVTYSTGGAAQTLATGTTTTAGLKWVHHDGTGYFFNQIPSSASIQSAAQTGTWQSINAAYDATVVSKDVFALSIRHGTAFSNATYAYTVVPGITGAEMAGYSSGIDILRNDANVQAIHQNLPDVTQATFHVADSISPASGQTLAANAASLVMLRTGESALHLSASSPEAKTMSLGLQLTGVPLDGWLGAFGQNTGVTLGLPGGDLAGSTVGLQITTDGAPDPVVSILGSGGFTSLACTFGAAVALPGNTTLLTNATSLSFTGAISGAGSLTKTSNTPLQLSGANSHTGGTRVLGGTITVSNNQSAATGGWEIGPTSATMTTVNFQAGSTVASSSRIRLGNSTASGNSTQTLNAAGTVTNDGELYVGRPGVLNINSGGNWTQRGPASLNGHGGYNSTLTVNSGGTFSYQSTVRFLVNPAPGSNAPATLTMAGGNFTTSSGFTNAIAASNAAASILINTGGTLQLSADIPDLLATSGTPFLFQLGTGGGKIDTNGYTAVMNGAISNANGETGSLTKTGSGTLTLTAANTHSGGTTVAAGGGTLVITRPEALGSGPVSVPKAGTASGTLALALTGVSTIPNVFSGFNSTTISGDSTVPTILNLSGNTTLTSDLTISGSGGNGLHVRSDGGLLTLAGTIRQTVGTIRTLGLGGNGDGIVSGNILTSTGGLALTKDGSGTWTLSGSNTYPSKTNISAGTLRIGGNGTPGTGEIAINTGARLDFSRSGDLTISNLLSGGGELLQSGSGRITLTGPGARSGPTRITAGTLELAAATLPDAASLEISSDAMLSLAHGETDTIASLTFDGIPQLSGTWGAPGSGATHESARLSGSGLLLVTRDPFDLWLDAHPALADRSESGDPDHDGWANLIEFALGLDPLSPDPPAVSRIEDGQLVLEFSRTAPPNGHPVVPEGSENLTEWSGEGLSLDETDAPVIRVKLPTANDPRRFLRLRVTRP